MKGTLITICAATAILSSPPTLSSSESQPPRFDFEEDAEGWEAIPATPVTLSINRDSSAGAGHALEVRYRVEKSKVAGIRRGVEGLEGAGVRVTLKTDSPTVMVIGVMEMDGSAYHHVIQATTGEWQQVVAAFTDFQLAGDSKDENGHLDVNQVRALIIANAAGFMSDGGEERRFLVGAYEILDTREAGPTKAGASAPEAVDFDFEDGTEGWIVIPGPGGGPAKLRVTRGVKGIAAGSGALEVRYRVEKNKVAGVLRPIGGLAGAGVRALLMTDSPAVLVLGLVERDGSSYHHVVRTRGGEWEEVETLFQSFSLADDSKDENRRLDLDQLQALVVADAAGFLSEGGAERKLWVGKYEIVSNVKTDSRATEYVPLLTTGARTDSGTRATAGISYRPGKFDRGFLADAAGELVAVPTRGLKREEGTIELWISPQFDMGEVRDFSGLLAMQAEPFAKGFRTSLLLVYSKTRQIVFLLNAETERSLSTPTLDWKAGEWHHLAASWGSRGMRLYLDGSVVAENRHGDGPGALASDVVLGNHAWTLMSNRIADTVIDEFRLSSGQRSDREIEGSARADRPSTADELTVALEHFDGQPAPPLTLASEVDPFHTRVLGEPLRVTVAAPERFPSGSRLSYDLSRAGGASVHRGEAAAPSGEARANLSLPTVEWPGFYRIDLRLEREGKILNQGEDWIQLVSSDTSRGAGSLLFGAAVSFAELPHDEGFFRAAAAAGASSVRVPFEWAEIEPRDDRFVWDKYDRYAAWAARHGVELVPTLFWENPQPDWAGRGKANPSGLGSNIYPPEDMKEWDEFVFRVVERYKENVRWWIPANEPNLARYWHPKPDAKAYVALLKATREAALRADPDAKIVGLSVSGIDLRFLEAAFKEGALDYSDAVGVHPYRSPYGPDERVPVNVLADPGSQKGNFLEGLQAVRDLMKKYGARQQKIWLDEVGQPYRDDFIDPGWGVSEETAAVYLVKNYIEAMASGAVERVLWYSFWGGEYGSFALLTPDGSPTLPFVAYVATAERLSGAEVVGEGRRGREIRSLKLSSSGESMEVLWTLAGTKEIPLEAGERALDLYGFPLEQANLSRRLTLTSSPCFLVRPES